MEAYNIIGHGNSSVSVIIVTYSICSGTRHTYVFVAFFSYPISFQFIAHWLAPSRCRCRRRLAALNQDLYRNFIYSIFICARFVRSHHLRNLNGDFYGSPRFVFAVWCWMLVCVCVFMRNSIYIYEYVFIYYYYTIWLYLWKAQTNIHTRSVNTIIISQRSGNQLMDKLNRTMHSC